MALPSGTTGGSGLSRSEAAILAWKKRERAKPVTPGGLSPKIAARVKEILAAKQKKGKPKVAKGGKGKAPKKIDPAKAKEKAARLAERATAKQERDKAKAERATAATAKKQERDKAKVERVAAQASKQQATLKKQKAAAQAQKQKAKAGASAKQAKEQSSAAAAKENAEKPAKEKAANRAKVAQEMAEQDLGLAPSGSAALSDFADGKPLKPETAAEFEKMGLTEKDEAGNHRLTTEGRVAANAMSKGDTRAAIDAISRAGSKKTKADQPKERKAIDMSDLAIKAGARHSRSDIQHLQSIHDSSVACGASCDTESDDDSDMPMDDEEEGVKAIKGIMDNPLYYAQHECSDIMQAANALSTMAMLIQSELVEDDEDTKHVDMLCDAAETLIEFIQSEIDELRGAAKNAANDASMGPMNKAVDDVWLHIDGDAIKALDNDVIRGYAVRFGDADHADLQRDYYTKATDFWLDHFGWPRPITYHHGMDAGTRNDPVVGHWLKAGVDERTCGAGIYPAIER